MVYKHNLAAVGFVLVVLAAIVLIGACATSEPGGLPPADAVRQPLDMPWPDEGTPEPPSRGVGVLYDNCPGCGDNTDFLATFKVWDPQDLEQCQSPIPYCDPLISGDPIGVVCEYDARNTSFYGGTWQLSYVVKVVPDTNWSITGLETYIYDDGDIATEPVTLTIRSGPTFITSTLEATSVISGTAISNNTGQVTCYYFGAWSPKATFSFSPAVSMTSGQTYWVVFSTDDTNGYLMPVINGAAKGTGGCEQNEAIDCGDDYATKPGWYDNIYEWVVKPTTTPTQFYSILAQELAIPLAFNSDSSATNTPTVTGTPPTATPTPTPTVTGTPPTATPTVTPTPTITPTPTVTPTPGTRLEFTSHEGTPTQVPILQLGFSNETAATPDLTPVTPTATPTATRTPLTCIEPTPLPSTIATVGPSIPGGIPIPVDDTFICETEPSDNFGNWSTLSLNDECSILMRWPLAADFFGKTVISAKLRLFLVGQPVENQGDSVFFVNETIPAAGGSNWTELGATWQRRNQSAAWTTLGARAPLLDYNPDTIGYMYVRGMTTGWVDIALSPAAVQGWISSPSTNYGIIVWSETAQNDVRVTASEWYDRRFSPQLILETSP